MPEISTSNVWLWKDPDSRWLKKVLTHLKSFEPLDCDIITLHCEDINGFDLSTSIPLTNYFFQLCMIFNLLEHERMMFLNLKDVISAIELCLGREKKTDVKVDTDISKEEIIEFYNNYVNCFSETAVTDNTFLALKEFMNQSNCIDTWMLLKKCQSFQENSDIINHIGRYKYLLLGTPTSLIDKHFISILCGQMLYSISLEIPLDTSLHNSPSTQASDKIKIVDDSMKLEELALKPPNEVFLGSATEEYVEDIVLAFLSLLVNSRNELALSKTMISPVIDLSHGAFTALKHLSVEKDMPMCQVAISYVTRIRLGGKGYAPPNDCPMLPHLTKLELFVDMLNQMQTIIEEDSKPSSAIKKLINVLKRKLLKCNNNKLKESAIEIAAEKLQVTLLQMTEVLKSKISCTNSQICQEALDVLYNFVNFLNSNYFIHDPETAIEKKHAKRTPLNLPPLLGYFRSPEEESSCDTRVSIDEESDVSRSSVVQRPAFPSYFHHSESSEISTSCVYSSTPSKISFKGCINENKENQTDEIRTKRLVSSCNSGDAMLTKESRKRSILGEITNETVKGSIIDNDVKNCKKSCKTFGNNDAKRNAAKANKKVTKKEPKNLAKKFKQIQGQGKITKFFIKR